MKSLLCSMYSPRLAKSVILCAILGMIPLLNAQWARYPSVNTPVCTETDEQLGPDITSDGAGGSIITWYDKRGGSEYDIYAQRFDALGNPQWATDGVLVCNTSGDQLFPVIAPDGNGGAYIAYISVIKGDNAIYAQLIDASGSIQFGSDGVELRSPGVDNRNTRIISDNNGYAIVVWEDLRNGNADIYAQRIGTSGKPEWNYDGVEICVEVKDQRTPELTMDYDNTNAIITWDDARKSGKAPIYDIYAQKIDLLGAVQWNANGIAVCSAVGDQFTPSIVSDDSGGAIITWHDIRGTGYDIYAQRVNSAGTDVWALDGIAVCTATGNQMNAQITVDGAFGAIITWIDSRTSGASHVYSQRIGFAGNPLWTSNGVVICGSAGSRKIPVIISDQSGGAIIAWSDIRNASHYDIYAQNINASGLVQWSSNGTFISSASNDQLNYNIVSDDFGGAFLAWNDSRNSSIDIYTQNLLKDGGLGIVPEISVRGNHILILDNDNNPSASDNSDFGSVLTLTPISRTFMIYNTGNKDLEITNIYTNGAQKTEFVPQTMTYPLTIGVRDSVAIMVTFSPVSVGISNAVLNFDNNDSNESVYNFAIRGIFKAAEIDVKGNLLSIVDGDATPDFSDSTDFGKLRVNSSAVRTYTIVNAGTDTLKVSNMTMSGTHSSEFTFPNITFPRKLGPGKTMNLVVTFLPTATGTRNAVINIASNDPNEATYDFAIKGTSVVPALIVKGNFNSIADGDVSPAQNDFTDFGKLHISKQKAVKFKLFNTGTDILSVSGISMGGLNSSDFSIQSMTYPQTINEGDSMEVEVNFAPLALGSRVAEISINSDDDSKPTYNFSLQATAIDREINVKGAGLSIAAGDNTPSSPDNTAFGNVIRNGSKTNRFYVLNPGTDVLTVSGLSLSGTNAALFSIGALTPASPIAPGDSAYFEVSFNPTSNGLKSAVVNISSDDADESAYNFAVQGLSVSPQIAVKGNQVAILDGSTAVSALDNTNFGSVEIPNTITKSFRILNRGNDALVISSMAISGLNASEFALQSMAFPKNLAAGDSLIFDITFTPSDTSNRKAIVTISSNDLDVSSFDFTIQGHATRKKVGLSENQYESQVSVFPNPAVNVISLSLPMDVTATVSILTTDGKALLNKVEVSSGKQVDISGLAAGVYMVSIEINGDVVNKKLVVNR